MLKVCGVPGQAPQKGFIVILAVMLVFVLLIGVNEGITPFPEEANPILLLLLVHV